MSDRRDRERRRRSRSPRDRDRHRDRDRRDRDRGRRDRDRTERREDKEKGRKDDPSSSVEAVSEDSGVQNQQLNALASQLEEETRKRRERVEAWREAQKRREARLREAEEEELRAKNGTNGECVPENENVGNDDDEGELQEESDDEDMQVADAMGIELNAPVANGNDEPAKITEDSDDEVDPLDVYMSELARAERAKAPDTQPAVRTVVITDKDKIANGPAKGDIIDNEEEPTRVLEDFDINEECKSLIAKGRSLVETDHTKVYYRPFRKTFYAEVPDIARMSKKEVDQYRQLLDNIKVRGKKAPKPIKNWAQAGVSLKVLNVLKKCKYEKPTPIQAQAVPAILSGRDVIGIAKTGSGKTLAFLLPMFRHVLDQDPLDELDGPIGIIMSPTRELALQTYKEAYKFCKPLDLRVVCVYGGVAISDQIADLKKGAEIIVCTPGRMIDMLAANGGKVTNLRRVTYLVMDEADRMFDMGFEPQVMKIVNNIRPDRQTVLFSATFPKQMEALARKVLKEPVEIQVGGKSVVCNDVDQHALVLDEHLKIFKLLELLGQFYEFGSVLVFVEKQEKADDLVSELMAHGYNCAPLHGGIDQFDRDSAIVDFKQGKLKVLVATSVAARGLDVKNLILVVNYDCPNHYEDYVHRVGRTGRAGNKGYSYTFILPQGQERLAGEVCRAYETAGLQPPPDVKELWERYRAEQEEQGHTVHLGGSGFSGSGFKYDQAESEHELSKRMFTKLVHGIENGNDDDDDTIEDQLFSLFKTKTRTVTKEGDEPVTRTEPSGPGTSRDAVKLTKEQQKQQETKTAAAHAAAQRIAEEKRLGAIPVVEKDATAVTAEAVLRGQAAPELKLSAKAQAKQIAERLNNRLNYMPSAINPIVNPDFHANYVQEDLEINDFPQQIRYKICSRDSVAQVQEFANVGISVKGTHYPPGREPKEGQDRKLYLQLEARDEFSLRMAKEEIIRIIKDTLRAAALAGKQPVGGRYKLF